MSEAAAADELSFSPDRFERGLRFVWRVYVPRTVGLALGGLSIGTVFYENMAPAGLWVFLVLGALVWPHVAFWLARRSPDPFRAELRNLTVDSALGGASIAFMQFNLLPSVLLGVMLSMDKLAAGGPRFLARCTVALLAGCLVAAVLTGFAVRPGTSAAQIVGSLPLLAVYPLAVAATMYNMVRRMQYQNRQLEELARTDGLSQVLSREAWEEAVGEEFVVARRSGLRASLLFVHIDNLNRINQRHGYSAGDEVIRSVAAIVRETLRADGAAGRYGGERFGALLRNTDAAQARALAERIRERVASAILDRGEQVTGTVSIGVAEVNPRELGFRDWIARADRAVGAAKARGNSVESSAS